MTERLLRQPDSAQATATDFGDLDTEFIDMLAALGEHRSGRVLPQGSHNDPSDFSDIHAAFAQLRASLSLPPGVGMPEVFTEPGRLASHPYADALVNADAAAAEYADSPEWQRITRISDAARDLAAAVRESAADYWAEVSSDIRFQGFIRAVAVRVARAIAAAASALATRLDQQGGRPARGRHALSSLTDAAAEYAPSRARPHAGGRAMQDSWPVITGNNFCGPSSATPPARTSTWMVSACFPHPPRVPRPESVGRRSGPYDRPPSRQAPPHTTAAQSKSARL